MPEVQQPVVEPSHLAGLREETQNDAAVLRFVASFLVLLPGRVNRILNAVRARDAAAAMDAVLSLKVTSAMIGALRMEQLCRCVEKAVACGDFDAAGGAGAGVERHSGQLALALEAPLCSRPGPCRPVSVAW